jgi:hypothetical protein
MIGIQRDRVEVISGRISVIVVVAFEGILQRYPADIDTLCISASPSLRTETTATDYRNRFTISWNMYIRLARG